MQQRALPFIVTGLCATRTPITPPIAPPISHTQTIKKQKKTKDASKPAALSFWFTSSSGASYEMFVRVSRSSLRWCQTLPLGLLGRGGRRGGAVIMSRSASLVSGCIK